MSTIFDTDLTSLLPANMRSIVENIAFCAAFDYLYREMVGNISKVLIVDIDNQFSEIVDYLAVERHTDFYDQSLSLANRRNLVKNTFKYKYQKGTAYAIELVVTNAFVDADADVLEWFDYGGAPYFFKVHTVANMSSQIGLNLIGVAIESVKNKRSFLELIGFIKTTSLNFYLGFASKQTRAYRVSKQL